MPIHKIVVGWLDDIYCHSIKTTIESLLGTDAIELRLMASLLDVLNTSSYLGDRPFDLLVLDYKMDEEQEALTDSSVIDAASLKERTLATNDTCALQYYNNVTGPGMRQGGGFVAWNCLGTAGCLPSTPNRVVMYSANVEAQSRVPYSAPPGSMRFYKKQEYILPTSRNPEVDWSTYYSTVCSRMDDFAFVNAIDGSYVSAIQRDDINPEASTPSWVIVDVNGEESTCVVVPCSGGGIEATLSGIRSGLLLKRAFLEDLKNIGLGYMRISVDRGILKDVLDLALNSGTAVISASGDPYWTQALSHEESYWTLATLFPAYYNEGAVFSDSERRAALEQEIRREMLINWTYELGRVLRTGAYFLDGHRGKESAPSYPNGDLVTNGAGTLGTSLQHANAAFCSRTGLKLPFESGSAYDSCLDAEMTRIAVRYSIDEMDKHTGLAVQACNASLTEYGLSGKIALGILGQFDWDGVSMTGNDARSAKVSNDVAVLSAFPTPGATGIQVDNGQVLSRNVELESPWCIERILTKEYFKDVFCNRPCWVTDNSHGLYFCKGQTLWSLEAGGRVKRYFRFLCLARTTLRWERTRLLDADFLNKTKKSAWFDKGLHHHVRAYILSLDDKGGSLIFDLALGAGQRISFSNEEIPVPLSEAHGCVLSLLRGHNVNGCVSFVYLGYDVFSVK